jgi:hypothetical protein
MTGSSKRHGASGSLLESSAQQPGQDVAIHPAAGTSDHEVQRAVEQQADCVDGGLT